MGGVGVSDENELLLDSDEEEAEVEDSKPKSGGKGLRAELEAQLAARKAAEAKATELETKYQEVQEKVALSELKEAGLTQKQAVAFRKMYGDVTEDSLREFRVEVLGQEVEASPTEVAEEVQEEVKAPTFRPTASTTSSSPGKRTYTTAEWNALRQEDSAKADKVLREGRIERNLPPAEAWGRPAS